MLYVILLYFVVPVSVIVYLRIIINVLSNPTDLLGLLIVSEKKGYYESLCSV
jgi:hypothetical protein